MPERHLLPFALPRGRQKDTARLTVYFAPRLKESGPLSGYPEWLDWPATLTGALNLVVAVNGTVTPHRRVGIAPSSAVWRAVFGPQTPVAAHRFVDFSKTPIQPMASSDFSEAVLDLYLGVARSSPDGPPSGSDLLALAVAAGLPMTGGGGSGPGSLAEAAAYRAPMDDQAVEPEDPLENAPRFDFHASVSLLGHHPELLRHLGLALDLEVELVTKPTTVSVTTGYGVGQRSEVELVTMTTPSFLARPNPAADLNEQSGGFLTLAAEKAFLSIVDPHLAAARLTASAELAADHDDGTLPALATRALTLVRPDVTNAFANRTVRQADLEQGLQDNLAGGPPVVLFAEDVTIGHKIDVGERGPWRSLFERRSDTGYRFPRVEDLAVVPAPDEGWNTLLLVTEQDDQRPPVTPDRDDPIEPTARFRLDDAMYRWDGWSGAVPPPSSTLDGVSGEAVPKDDNQPADAALQPTQVAVDYRVVPGSLPRLRFGRRYRMRARCVDLAGNSQPLGARSSAGSVVGPEPFGRLEPVAAPTVVRRSPRPVPGVGDTPSELVMRSDYDEADDAVAPVDRLLFPGRVGQDLCELHGLPSGGADAASYAELAARDALDLADQTDVDPVTGELVADGPARQDVAYLSDPAVGGARFGFPSLGTAFAVPVPGTWPARESVRLVVLAGEKPTVAQPDPETDLLVFVPKAEIVPVEASFSMADVFIDHFGLWQRFSVSEQGSLEEFVAGGAHWMFTPARPLTLVHAVRRPLLAPSVLTLNADRALGSSSVRLRGALVAHTKSTERVTIAAGWTDTVDDVALDAPVLRSTRLELGNLLVARSEKNEVAIESLRSELHDTKRHLATIDVEAFSSFASYFTEERTVTVGAEPVLLDERGVVVGTVEVTVPATGEKARAGVDFVVDGSSNTILFVQGGALAAGDQPTVRYIPLPISRASHGEHDSPPPFELLFENTAVPPPPSVAEVVPAFARIARSENGSVARSGQVLRVYLDRPWLVTGEGEQLAVVLDPPTASPPALTVVGRDPILPGPGPESAPTAVDFPRAVTVATAVDGAHDVAGHAVAFDVERGRWFADIELAPAFGYRPFVRLTVARYQPDSVDGAALSTFVTLEPVRLGVVRTTTVTRRGDVAEVAVTGVDGLGNAVQVTVQEADASIDDPDLRWRTATDPVRLVPSVDADGVTTWSGAVDLPQTVAPLRTLVEELEPGLRDVAGAVTTVETTVHVETVDLPTA